MKHPNLYNRYAHHAWAESMGVKQPFLTSRISFLCDSTGDLTRAWNLGKTYDDCSLGFRSKRFSMVVDDGIVTSYQIVEDAAEDASVILSQLR